MPLDNQIQRGDLLQRLSRGLEIKGRTPVMQLDNIVAPIVVLEDLTRQSEFVTPKDRSAGIGLSIAAVAAEFGGAALINPIDSGVVVILDRVVVSPATAQVFQLSELNAATVAATYATANFPIWLDKRNDGIPTATVLSGSDPGTISTAPGPIESQRIGSSGPFPFWPETGGIVLRAGRAIIVECQTVNVAFNMSFRWREISEP